MMRQSRLLILTENLGHCVSALIVLFCKYRPPSSNKKCNCVSGKSMFRKIFDEEMFVRTLPTTLLEIFYRIILNSKVII